MIHPIHGNNHDYDELLLRIGEARFVLIGEASHGTHEFYRERAHITRRLIEEKGFQAVVVEADWPDAQRVHRFVQGKSTDTTARQALGDFERFPQWMWRNQDVEDFVSWLHEYNADHAQVGFYGMDLYSLHRSMAAVVSYLETTDPAAAERARKRYACFEHFGIDPQLYGYATGYGMAEPCEDAAVAQLLELQQRVNSENHFFAEQNARLALNAERYYRAMFRGRPNTWNLRDQHMFETLVALQQHLQGAKMVVWAHNSHIGDARGSEMGWEHGEISVGQLVREYDPEGTYIIAQSTYHGEVTAADQWDGATQHKLIRPALAGSYEELLHQTGRSAFWLDLKEHPELSEQRLQRFIGVIYAPATERQSHYISTQLSAQYNALLFFDQTTALKETLNNTNER